MIQVIFVPCHRGDGSLENPERVINQYFSLDGELLACYDEINGPPDSFRSLTEAGKPEPGFVDVTTLSAPTPCVSQAEQGWIMGATEWSA